MILLWILLACTVLVLLIAYACYRKAFYAKNDKHILSEEECIPPGEIYAPYRDLMLGWVREVRQFPYEAVSIRSFDGLTLTGKYYEYAPGAPMELMFHGYRGSAERDLCGGVQRCFALGRNVLLVDQRTSGQSDGHVITFGIHEHRDCLAWADFCVKKFGPDVTIILTGISMGAATVLMAAGKPLPKQVAGVLADCGYTTARAMIEKTIREMHLPVKAAYPFVKLGAKLFGHFDPEAYSPLEAMQTCTVPILFAHGEADGFVPCEMSRINHAACVSPKGLITVPGADHGLCYPADPEGYLHALADFWTAHGVPTTVQNTSAKIFKISKNNA